MWILYAHEDGGRLWHVGHKRWVELHGLKYPIVPVRVSIIAEGKGEPQTCYGWQKTGEYDKPPAMIWPHWTPFSICFTYGPEAEVKAGKGRIVQLLVEKIAEGDCPNP